MNADAVGLRGSLLQLDALLERRRTDAARSLLATALKEFPDDPDLLFQAARADWIDDRLPQARSTVAQLLRHAPEHHGARILLFELMVQAGEAEQAEALVLQLLRENPYDADLCARYARLMLRTLHFDKAQRLAAEAVRLDPGSDAGLRAQALCDLVTKRRTMDSAALQRMLQQHPDDYHTLELVLVALLQDGRTHAAHAVAQTLLRARPDDPVALQRVQALALQAHWTMWPLYPLTRFGWPAVIALWLGSVLALNLLRKVSPPLAALLSPLLLGYVVYSWVWPPLLKRWLQRG
jgi:tetratricopeptide (TPR) repeat protein